MNSSLSFNRLFFKVWIHPRQTIRQIIEVNPGYFIWPLVFFSGLFSSLSSSTYFPFLKKPLYFVVPIGITYFIVMAFVNFYLFSGWGYWAGKKLGGKGSYKSLQTATAWSYPPAIIAELIFVFDELPDWLKIAMGETSGAILIGNVSTALWHHLLILFAVALLVWTSVLWIFNLSEVHKLPIWKSFFISLVLTIPSWWLSIHLSLILLDESRKAF